MKTLSCRTLAPKVHEAKVFLSPRSPLRGYGYAKSVRGGWFRATQITEGMRWNYYLAHGQTIPQLFRKDDVPALMEMHADAANDNVQQNYAQQQNYGTLNSGTSSLPGIMNVRNDQTTVEMHNGIAEQQSQSSEAHYFAGHIHLAHDTRGMFDSFESSLTESRSPDERGILAHRKWEQGGHAEETSSTHGHDTHTHHSWHPHHHVHQGHHMHHSEHHGSHTHTSEGYHHTHTGHHSEHHTHHEYSASHIHLAHDTRGMFDSFESSLTESRSPDERGILAHRKWEQGGHAEANGHHDHNERSHHVENHTGSHHSATGEHHIGRYYHAHSSHQIGHHSEQVETDGQHSTVIIHFPRAPHAQKPVETVDAENAEVISLAEYRAKHPVVEPLLHKEVEYYGSEPKKVVQLKVAQGSAGITE